jgi:hypothetical protein
VTGILDRLLEVLADLDEQVRVAGRAHLKGDSRGACRLLDDLAIQLADLRADLRRELEPEPQP